LEKQPVSGDLASVGYLRPNGAVDPEVFPRSSPEWDTSTERGPEKGQKEPIKSRTRYLERQKMGPKRTAKLGKKKEIKTKKNVARRENQPCQLSKFFGSLPGQRSRKKPGAGVQGEGEEPDCAARKKKGGAGP